MHKTQRIPPLSAVAKKRLQSATTNFKLKHFIFVSSNKPTKLVNKSKVKLLEKQNQNFNIGECCGSPISWLKKSRRKHKDLSTKKSSLHKEDNLKFTNQCTDKSPTQFKRIDELIQTTNTSDDTSKANQSCEKNKSSLFQTMSQKIILDKYLHKTIKCKNGFTFKPGEIIKEGPHSSIYKCLNLQNGTIFVAKCYTDPKQKIKFKQELNIMKQLTNNENIIQYIGHEILLVKSSFIFMEYVSGGSLKQLLETYGQLPEELIRVYLKQILKALFILHSKHIAHCDLKCSNILIDSNTGLVKLSDFGSAKQNEHSFEENFFAKGLIGTLPWCAPEIICNKSYGTKVDIWSLGCCLIEMLNAKTPWSEKKIDNYYQCIIIIGKGNDIPEIPSNCSEELKSFILKCLIRNDNERASVQELLLHPFVFEHS